MKKSRLSKQDRELVAAAIKAVKKPVMQYWRAKATPQVAAALRLDSGKIITSTNLVADVASLSICAEPVAITEARNKHDNAITAIVAVYHKPGMEPRVIPPCGHCREIITDYAPGAWVVMREPGSEALFRVKAKDLLPLKYAEFWDGKTLL